MAFGGNTGDLVAIGGIWRQLAAFGGKMGHLAAICGRFAADLQRNFGGFLSFRGFAFTGILHFCTQI